tara:strand:+ start:422 stop:961 length:540 start_codon:yes stop_codon:yes gene_type:complete
MAIRDEQGVGYLTRVDQRAFKSRTIETPYYCIMAPDPNNSIQRTLGYQISFECMEKAERKEFKSKWGKIETSMTVATAKAIRIGSFIGQALYNAEVICKIRRTRRNTIDWDETKPHFSTYHFNDGDKHFLKNCACYLYLPEDLYTILNMTAQLDINNGTQSSLEGIAENYEHTTHYGVI